MAKITVVIGREKEQQRLSLKASQKIAAVGRPGSVPLSVSREHCSLEVEFTDTPQRDVVSIKVTNLKTVNLTSVDGLEVESKQISPDSQLQLGAERYTVDLPVVLDAMRKMLGEVEVVFSIAHLKPMLDDFNRDKLNVSVRVAKDANKQRLQGILSMSGMLVGFIPGIPMAVRFCIIVAALGVAIYFFVKGARGKTVPEMQYELDQTFKQNYVCPNPDCQHFIGYTPYEDILKRGACPYCKAKYKE